MIYGLKTADYVVEGLSFIDSLKTEDIEELLLKRTLELEVTTPELIINWIEDQLKHLRLEAYIKELANIRYSDLDSDGIEDKNDLQPLNHKIRFSEDFYER